MPEIGSGHAGPQDCERLAVAFGRLLRSLGLDVSVDSVLLYARSLALVGLAERAPTYWAGRSTLVHRVEDIAVYDHAFMAFWDDGIGSEVDAARGSEVTFGLDASSFGGDCDRSDFADSPDAVCADNMPDIPDTPDADGAGAGTEGRDAPVLAARWSRAEVLRERDFSRYTYAELAEARHLMSDLRFVGATRRSRRMRPSRRPTARPDLRRTVRASLRSGGEPIERAFQRPGERHRRLVLLLDVSGSMEPYARSFVHFLHAAVVSRGRVDAFAMGTRLTRLTRELRSRDPDAAIAAAARSAVDWSGGTRLGECLRSFNDTWGIPGMARGSVVVILSDGWDQGAPEIVGEQMARLHRVAHRIVWVNPLKASKGYAPLAGGMAAALPYIDDFLEGHSLEALERLGEVISR